MSIGNEDGFGYRLVRNAGGNPRVIVGYRPDSPGIAARLVSENVYPSREAAMADAPAVLG